MYLLTLLLSIQYRIGSQVPSEFSFPNYSLRNPPILAGFAGFEESLAHKRWGVMGREEGGGPISFPPDNWDSRTVEGAARRGEFFTALHLK